jgi:hypothetical protein
MKILDDVIIEGRLKEVVEIHHLSLQRILLSCLVESLGLMLMAVEE